MTTEAASFLAAAAYLHRGTTAATAFARVVDECETARRRYASRPELGYRLADGCEHDCAAWRRCAWTGTESPSSNRTAISGAARRAASPRHDATDLDAVVRRAVSQSSGERALSASRSLARVGPFTRRCSSCGRARDRARGVATSLDQRVDELADQLQIATTCVIYRGYPTGRPDVSAYKTCIWKTSP